MWTMNETQANSSEATLRTLEVLLPDLEALYKDVHSHPELSMQETRTAGIAADRLRAAGYDVTVRARVLAAITRIVNAEAEASGAPRKPEITTLDHYPLNVNDPEASRRVVEAFRDHFGAERVRETGPAPASEDFGSFGSEWHAPSVFWFVGGTAPDLYAKAKETNRLNELPVNHSPKFAPVIHPTLRTGIEALVVATRAWLSA